MTDWSIKNTGAVVHCLIERCKQLAPFELVGVTHVRLSGGATADVTDTLGPLCGEHVQRELKRQTDAPPAASATAKEG